MQSPTNQKGFLVIVFALCFLIGFSLTWLLRDAGSEETTYDASTPEPDISSTTVSDRTSAEPTTTTVGLPESSAPEAEASAPAAGASHEGSAPGSTGSRPDQEKTNTETKKTGKDTQKSETGKADTKSTTQTQTAQPVNKPEPEPKAKPLVTKDQMKKMLKDGIIDESKVSSLQIRVTGQRSGEVEVGNNPLDVHEKIYNTEIWSDIKVVGMTHDAQGRVTSVTICPEYP